MAIRILWLNGRKIAPAIATAETKLAQQETDSVKRDYWQKVVELLRTCVTNGTESLWHVENQTGPKMPLAQSG